MTDREDNGFDAEVNRRAPWGLVVTAAVAILVLVFAFSNRDSADFSFAGFNVEMPEWLLFLALVFIGIVIGWVLSAVRRSRARDRS
jgi:uncharacterized integral membrane protein